jgi:hypothetical protein
MNAQEKNFAYKMRHALNERLDDLPDNVTARLAHARGIAVSRKKKDAPVYVAIFRNAFAGITGSASGRSSWFGRMGLGLPALVLAVGLMGIVHYEEQRQIRETAAIDMAVLSDELPPAAYTDIGFSAYLERNGA